MVRKPRLDFLSLILPYLVNESKAIDLCLRYRDPAGFEYLVSQYRREAFYHAFSLLGNQEDAADACQDAFARAFAAMPRLSALDKFYPWFYRILRNRCLNLIDRRKTASKYADRQRGEPNGHLRGSTPAIDTEKREEIRQVWALLDKLCPEHREILTLKYIHGNSYEEISQTLDIPRGTVMSRLYAARNAFRKQYEYFNPTSP